MGCELRYGTWGEGQRKHKRNEEGRRASLHSRRSRLSIIMHIFIYRVSIVARTELHDKAGETRLVEAMANLGARDGVEIVLNRHQRTRARDLPPRQHHRPNREESKMII